jgi:hypothetical protein
MTFGGREAGERKWKDVKAEVRRRRTHQFRK